MSLDLVRSYQQERDNVLNALEHDLVPNETVVVLGSVARAEGPFGDIDVVNFSESSPLNCLGARVLDLKVQPHLFNPGDDFRNYLHDSPRGAIMAMGNAVVGDGPLKDQIDQTITEAVSELTGNKRYDLMALLLAEQFGDTQRSDVRDNVTRYALKRTSGSKRTMTRSLLLASLMAEPTINSGQPIDRFTALLEQQLIDEDVITAMFAINCLLVGQQQGRLIAKLDWESHIGITKPWVDEISRLGTSLVSTQASPIASSIADAESSIPAAQLASLEKVKSKLVGGILSRAILWRLVANPSVAPEVLQEVWDITERSQATLREIGCVIVQHARFDELTIDSTSKLLNHPDVKFSARYARQKNKN